MYILQLSNIESGQWIEVNAEQTIVTTQAIATLADCPKISPADLLVILVPGEQVNLMKLELPKMRAAERLRAAPYALEEQLAVEPDSIYVALSPNAPDGSAIAAVLNKTYFDQSYHRWYDAGLFPRIVLPDFLALTWTPETWTVVFHQQMALIRTGLYSGYTIDANNAPVFLALLLDQLTEHKPTKIQCWQEDSVVSLESLSRFSIPIDYNAEEKKNKFDIAGIAANGLNLLQGEYRPKLQKSELIKNWMLCGISTVVLMGFVFFSNVVQWIYWHHEANKLQTVVLQTYQQLFPGSQSVMEPRYRVLQLLKQYENAAHGGTFLKLFRAAGTTLLHFPDIQVQSLQYDGNALQLMVAVKSSVMLTDWVNALHAEKVSVKQGATKSVGGVMQVPVTVSKLA